MKCSNCGAEMDDDLNYCRNCGNILNQEDSKSCPKCGKSIKADNSFCTNCGYNFKNQNIVPISLGLIGSVIGIILDYYLVNLMYSVAYFDNYGLTFNLWLNYNLWALLLFIPPIIGFITTVYLEKNRRFGAIGMIISAVLFFCCIIIGWIPCFLVGLGGILALRK